MEKIIQLNERIEELAKENVVLAFSGGVDSALLLAMLCQAAKKYNTEVHAVTVQTRLHPLQDMEIAKRVAKEQGAVFHLLKIDELAETGIEKNPKDRCYRCKKGIFQKIKKLAEQYDIKTVLEGTNQDDLSEYRPGLLALKELGIVSPFAECGICKETVRKLARQLGVSVAERPSAPCLATRLPYGTTISYEQLEKIDQGEQFLRELGFYNVRLRVHNSFVRIEVDQEKLEMVLKYKKVILEKLSELGFQRITLDLNGFRSGSMDET